MPSNSGIKTDKITKAFGDYLRLCKAGGTKPFLQLLEVADLENPFKDGTIKKAVEPIKEYLSTLLMQVNSNKIKQRTVISPLFFAIKNCYKLIKVFQFTAALNIFINFSFMISTNLLAVSSYFLKVLLPYHTLSKLIIDTKFFNFCWISFS